MKIEELSPNLVWKNFYAITQIPHPSGHLEKISDFIVDFSKKLYLQTEIDEIGNILIRKPATKGKENSPSIVLQAHLDMVPQKNNHIKHHFETDPLDVFIDGDWVKARNTTLGADNGIGMAMALAVLESEDIEHPNIEVLLTVDEETGMFGALALKKGFLKGEILLNLDSEEEGELFVGCSGGVDANIKIPFQKENVPHGTISYEINIKGLIGGHSGLDIHKGRANANILICRFLQTLINETKAQLASVNGGNLHNAIPREAMAVVTFSSDETANILKLVKTFENKIKKEFEGIEDGLTFHAKETNLQENIIPIETSQKILKAVLDCPNGVINFMQEMPEVVETSSNLSVIKTNTNSIEIQCLLRSASAKKQKALCSEMEKVFIPTGAKIDFIGDYPGWEPNFDSPILKKMKTIYNSKFGKEPEIKVIHAGLECGIIKAEYPHMDMISFGPTIVSPHSPDEKVSIKSVDLCWEFLVEVLGKI